MLENREYKAISYDKDADTVYVTFSTGPVVARTLEVLADWLPVLMDVDAKGNPVGLEIVGVRQLGLEYIIQKLEQKTGNQEPEHKPNPVEMLRKLHMSGQSLDPETAETYLAEVYEDRWGF
jgi:uncharacterized protein YuzE